MKPEGIRKVFAEQGPEGAIYFLAHALEAVLKTIDNLQATSPEAEVKPEEKGGN